MRSNLLRLATGVGETTFAFHPSDANGFPRHLPPARKIGIGRRALAGLQPSSKLEEGASARFESSLERDFFALLEFSNDVVSWEPQPVRIPAPTGTYVPDVLVHYVGPSRDLRSIHRVLYEIKYRDELRQKWQELRPKYRAATRFAREQGWKFRVVTELEIRRPLLWNAKFLLPYVHEQPSDEDCVLLKQTLAAMTESTPAELLGACSRDRWVQARLLSALWYLIGGRAVGTDLTQRLTMTSPIWHA